MRVLATLLVLLCVGCSKPEAPAAPSGPVEAPRVFVVNYPLEYFVARMAPQNLEVRFPIPKDVDPAFWTPTPDTILQYQVANLIVLNGAGYARWTRYATLPDSKIITSTDPCMGRLLRDEPPVRHQHGPEGEHQHGGLAFTTWLDVELAICQAESVRDALLSLEPSQRAQIEGAFKELERELAALHDDLRNLGKAAGKVPIVASHPVYQYLAAAYGLNLASVHFEPDEEPSEEAMAELTMLIENHPARLMLWEGEPVPSTKAKLEAMGIESVVFDPLAQAPEEGDFVSAMKANISRLACGLGDESCS